MDDFVVIALFRHGMTVANERQEYLGWTDSPLILGQNYSEHTLCFEQIYTSDLGRCRVTAVALFPEINHEVLPYLRELNFGDWEGHTYEQLKSQPMYQKWLAEPFKVVPPNGESFPAFSRRVEDGWRKISQDMLEKGFNTSAVVTHGGVIRYLLARYSSEKRDFWEWRIPHGHGYQLTWKRESFRRGERCTLLQEVPLMANHNGLGSNID